MKRPWTRGPWWVCDYDAGDGIHDGFPSIQAPDEEDCAIVHWDGFVQAYWRSANGHEKQIHANAKLMASSPEMAEALYRLVIGRHTHVAGQEIVDGQRMIDKCEKCGSDLRSDIHYREGEDERTDIAAARKLLVRIGAIDS